MKKTKPSKRHAEWLKVVQDSIDIQKPLDYFYITPKRIDILIDLGLIKFAPLNGWANYILTDEGIKHLEKFIQRANQ